MAALTKERAGREMTEIGFLKMPVLLLSPISIMLLETQKFYQEH